MEKEKEEYKNIEQENDYISTKYDVFDNYINARYQKEYMVASGLLLILISLASYACVVHIYSSFLTALTLFIWLLFNVLGILSIIKGIKDFTKLKFSFPILPNSYRNILYNQYLDELAQKKRLKTIGIILCVLSLLPPMLLMGINDHLADISMGIFISFIAIGVFLIKISSSKTRALEYLLDIKKH